MDAAERMNRQDGIKYFFMTFAEAGLPFPKECAAG
jgi:hypothetical protein